MNIYHHIDRKDKFFNLTDIRFMVDTYKKKHGAPKAIVFTTKTFLRIPPEVRHEGGIMFGCECKIDKGNPMDPDQVIIQ